MCRGWEIWEGHARTAAVADVLGADASLLGNPKKLAAEGTFTLNYPPWL
jgi:hypothetical protein